MVSHHDPHAAHSNITVETFEIWTYTCALEHMWEKREAASGGLTEGVDKAERGWQRMHHISEDLPKKIKN